MGNCGTREESAVVSTAHQGPPILLNLPMFLFLSLALSDLGFTAHFLKNARWRSLLAVRVSLQLFIN